MNDRDAIVAALSSPAFLPSGWTRSMRCPRGTHAHDATQPAFVLNTSGHGYCFKCGESILIPELLDLLGISPRPLSREQRRMIAEQQALKERRAAYRRFDAYLARECERRAIIHIRAIEANAGARFDWHTFDDLVEAQLGLIYDDFIRRHDIDVCVAQLIEEERSQRKWLDALCASFAQIPVWRNLLTDTITRQVFITSRTVKSAIITICAIHLSNHQPFPASRISNALTGVNPNSVRRTLLATGFVTAIGARRAREYVLDDDWRMVLEQNALERIEKKLEIEREKRMESEREAEYLEGEDFDETKWLAWWKAFSSDLRSILLSNISAGNTSMEGAPYIYTTMCAEMFDKLENPSKYVAYSAVDFASAWIRDQLGKLGKTGVNQMLLLAATGMSKRTVKNYLPDDIDMIPLEYWQPAKSRRTALLAAIRNYHDGAYIIFSGVTEGGERNYRHTHPTRYVRNGKEPKTTMLPL